ncbi:hypothetical protein [Paenibacillus sp. FSL R10-2734]|uniref:hypothetical protein n=1 Tax=Paenibacillus sp. FSL R10-2734 TaxID=2954691 RepID=UPI0030D78E84
MKKVLSFLLVFALIFQVVPVFASESQTTNTESWWDIDVKKAEENNQRNRMSDEEGISALKEIAKEQLDAQNASEEVYQVFYDYIENSYSENVNNFSARSKNVRMPRGGETFTQVYSGSLYAGTLREQLNAPTVTSSLIQNYQNGKLATWSDVTTVFVSYLLSSKYPVISHLIGWYGLASIMDDLMTADVIRQIRATGGASKYTSYNTSYGENTIFLPWAEYPYVDAPTDGTYNKNSSYTIY